MAFSPDANPVEGQRRHASEPQSLLDWRDMLRRSRRMVACTVLLCSGAGIVGSLLQRPTYRAYCSVLFKPGSARAGTGTAVSAASLAGPEAYFQTQIELFRSKALLARVFDGIKAHGYVDSSGSLSQAEIQFISRTLTVRAPVGTRMIDISCDAHNPVLAAAFANELVVQIIRHRQESGDLTTRSIDEQVNRAIEDLRAAVESAEQNLAAYALETGGEDRIVGPAASLHQARVLEVEEQTKAQVERLKAQVRYETSLRAGPDRVDQGPDGHGLREYQSKVAALKREIVQAGTLLTPNHYQMVQKEAELAAMLSMLDRERESLMTRIRNDYVAALGREQLISAAYVASRRKRATQAGHRIRYEALQLDLERDRKLYNTALKASAEASRRSLRLANDIAVIDSAKPPQDRHQPRLALNSLFSVISGGLIGLIAGLIRKNSDSKLSHVGEPARYLDVRELAAIPAYATPKDIEASGDGSYGGALVSILFSCGAAGEGGLNDRKRVIVLTSVTPKAGKTTLAGNLAVLLARDNREVLLVDGDYHRPRLHRLFGTANEHGLLDLLGGRPELRLSSLVQRTRIPRLSLLTSGVAPEQFQHPLQRAKAGELLREASLAFDYILIDTPSLLHLPDARIWGQFSDGIVLVFRSGRTERDHARTAVFQIAWDGIPLLGTVLTGCDPKELSRDARNN